MLASAEFLASILTRDEEGRYMFVPCYSPENAPPGGKQQQLTINSAMDVGSAKQLFRNLTRLAELGYTDNPKTKLWKEIVSGLPDYAVDESGDLKEWISPAHGNNNRHRHASHLYPLFHEVDPDFKKDRQLRAAAVMAIENRLKWRRKGPKGWDMSFGLVQLGLAAAHLEDTRHAYECVDTLRATWHIPGYFTLFLRQRRIAPPGRVDLPVRHITVC